MAPLQAFLAFAMKKFYSVVVALALAVTVGVPASAHAATYYSYDPAALTSLQARLQALLAQVQQLQAELARIRTQSPVVQPPHPEYQYCDGYYYSNDRCTFGTSRLRDIEVNFEHNYARVRIEYTTGGTVSRIYAADTREEVISFLMSETGHSRAQIDAVISYDNDDSNDDDDRDSDEDVDQIRVFIYSGDARAIVIYEDFDAEFIEVDNETDEDDIIEELADELDMDEDDVEDVTTFYTVGTYEVTDIDVTIDEDDEEAEARVHYRSGHTVTITYDTEDEDEIIEELADDLDMDEDDVEDLVDFDHENGSSNDEDVDSIDVTIYDDSRDSRVRVEYDDGDTDTFYYDTDDEDEIIEELADELDMDEDDVEDLADFTYQD